MATNNSKAQFLADLNNEQAQWEALLQEIGADHMTQPGAAANWSIKDIVAHLTGWRKRTVTHFQAALHNEPVPSSPWPANLETDDEINAWIYNTNKDRSLSDVLEESRQVFEQLATTLATFPEAELFTPGRFAWLEGEPLSGAAFFGHFHEEHESDMRAWLTKVKQEA